MGTKRIALENVEDIKDILKEEILTFMKANDLSRYGVSKICGLPASYVNEVFGSGKKAVSFGKLCEIAHQIGMKLTLVIEKK